MRERIYCSPVYQALTAAMQATQAVYLVHCFRQKYLVRVFAITTDPFSTYTTSSRACRRQSICLTRRWGRC